MTARILSLGPLVLVGKQAGPLFDVEVQDQHGLACGEMQLASQTWQSLTALVDVLMASDRRHKEDAEEIGRLRAMCRLNGEWIDHAANVEIDLRDQLAKARADRDTMENERDTYRDMYHHACRVHDEVIARYQPIVSVLGDWDWRGIVEDGCFRSDYERAMESAAKALAEVEGAIAKAKESNNG